MKLAKTPYKQLTKNNKEKEDIFFLSSIYLSSFVLATLLFISLFHLPFFVFINVLFYRGLLLLITSCTLLCIVLIFLKKKIFLKKITGKDIIVILVVTFSFNIVFFTLVPVTAERSMSIFILERMEKYSNQNVTTQEMTKVFKTEFVEDRNAVQKRFDEQVISGTIQENQNEYRITKEGHLLVSFFRFISSLFNVQREK